MSKRDTGAIPLGHKRLRGKPTPHSVKLSDTIGAGQSSVNICSVFDMFARPRATKGDPPNPLEHEGDPRMSKSDTGAIPLGHKRPRGKPTDHSVKLSDTRGAGQSSVNVCTVFDML